MVETVDHVANVAKELAVRGSDGEYHHSGGGIFGIRFGRGEHVYFFSNQDDWGYDCNERESGDHHYSAGLGFPSFSTDYGVIAAVILATVGAPR